jgi:uncharacterized protein YhbP (UPF0306 family)
MSREKKIILLRGVFYMVNIDSLSSEERELVEARREYQRKWREANKDKVKQHNKRFYEKKRAEQRAGETK